MSSDSRFFDQVIMPLRDKMYRFAISILGNSMEAEDIVQEVLIKIWEKRDYISQLQYPEAWAMTLVKNQCIDSIRVKKNKWDAFPTGFDQKDSGLNPEESASSRNLMEKLESLIRQLPEKQRMIIHLRDVEGYQYQEIADMMEISIDQVKVNLFRARQKLKEMIQPYYRHETR